MNPEQESAFLIKFLLVFACHAVTERSGQPPSAPSTCTMQQQVRSLQQQLGLADQQAHQVRQPRDSTLHPDANYALHPGAMLHSVDGRAAVGASSSTSAVNHSSVVADMIGDGLPGGHAQLPRLLIPGQSTSHSLTASGFRQPSPTLPPVSQNFHFTTVQPNVANRATKAENSKKRTKPPASSSKQKKKKTATGGSSSVASSSTPDLIVTSSSSSIKSKRSKTIPHSSSTNQHHYQQQQQQQQHTTLTQQQQHGGAIGHSSFLYGTPPPPRGDGEGVDDIEALLSTFDGDFHTEGGQTEQENSYLLTDQTMAHDPFQNMMNRRLYEATKTRYDTDASRI